MSRAQSKENKLAVLKIVNEKKNYLFGSIQNNNITKTEKQHAWSQVLRMAQSLGLARANRDWTYARDHLFGLWKSRTLAKRDNAKRTGMAGGKSVILDEVDNCILNILGNNEPSMVQGLCKPENDEVFTNLDSALESLQPQKATSSIKDNPRKRKLDVGGDKEAELRIKLLETELYKNKLEILWLEKKLGMKRSKFTIDLQEISDDER